MHNNYPRNNPTDISGGKRDVRMNRIKRMLPSIHDKRMLYDYLHSLVDIELLIEARGVSQEMFDDAIRMIGTVYGTSASDAKKFREIMNNLDKIIHELETIGTGDLGSSRQVENPDDNPRNILAEIQKQTRVDINHGMSRVGRTGRAQTKVIGKY